MSWSFHPGMKVVCIKNDPWKCVDDEPSWQDEKPEFGRIYTIREVISDGGLYLKLVEIVNRFDDEGGGAWFDARSFRPLVERRSDISIFTAMLTPKRVEEPA